MNIWLLRHIETGSNASGLIIGQLDPDPLIYSHISFNVPESFKDESVKIYSSTLNRCVATSQLVANKIYQLSGVKPLIEYTDNIMERNMGSWEGKKKAEIIAENPQKFKDGFFIPQLTPPNGESLQLFLSRANWLKARILEDNEKNIIISSHNQFLKLFSHIIKGDFELTNWGTTFFQHGIVTPLVL